MKNKYIIVPITKNHKLIKLILNHLFNLGYVLGDRKVNQVGEITEAYPSLNFDFHNIIFHSKDNEIHISTVSNFNEKNRITVEDIFNLPKYVLDYVEVKLNSEYTAKVFKDKIMVGCTTFNSSIIDDLVKARAQVQ